MNNLKTVLEGLEENVVKTVKGSVGSLLKKDGRYFLIIPDIEYPVKDYPIEVKGEGLIEQEWNIGFTVYEIKDFKELAPVQSNDFRMTETEVLCLFHETLTSVRYKGSMFNVTKELLGNRFDLLCQHLHIYARSTDFDIDEVKRF